jgi:hypothetical protein
LQEVLFTVLNLAPRGGWWWAPLSTQLLEDLAEIDGVRAVGLAVRTLASEDCKARTLAERNSFNREDASAGSLA